MTDMTGKIDRESLRRQAAEQGAALTERMLEQYDRYAALLTEWN